jgi:hypothetical protein
MKRHPFTSSLSAVPIALALSLSLVLVSGPAAAQHTCMHPASATTAGAQVGGLEAGEFGQGAFAAISEIVAILEADPETDWDRVDLGALRAHLVDMERLTVDAVVSERPVAGGLEILVSGPASAVDAARRMVPAHAAMVAADRGWTVDVADRAETLRILWTTADSAELAKLRGLGFFGLMAEGGHHQHHHLMIATGRDPHGSAPGMRHHETSH